MSEFLYAQDKLDREFKKIHLRIAGLENAIAELKLCKEYDFKKLSDEQTEEICDLVERLEALEKGPHFVKEAESTAEDLYLEQGLEKWRARKECGLRPTPARPCEGRTEAKGE